MLLSNAGQRNITGTTTGVWYTTYGTYELAGFKFTCAITPSTEAAISESHRVGGVLHHERLRAETDDVVAYHLLDGEIVSSIPDHDRPALLPIHDLADTDERIFQPRVLQASEKAPRE